MAHKTNRLRWVGLSKDCPQDRRIAAHEQTGQLLAFERVHICATSLVATAEHRNCLCCGSITAGMLAGGMTRMNRQTTNWPHGDIHPWGRWTLWFHTRGRALFVGSWIHVRVCLVTTNETIGGMWWRFSTAAVYCGLIIGCTWGAHAGGAWVVGVSPCDIAWFTAALLLHQTFNFQCFSHS